MSRSSALGSLRGERSQRGWREGEEERTERTLVVTKKACLQMVQMMFIWAALLCAQGEWGEESARAIRAHGGGGTHTAFCEVGPFLASFALRSRFCCAFAPLPCGGRDGVSSGSRGRGAGEACKALDSATGGSADGPPSFLDAA